MYAEDKESINSDCRIMIHFLNKTLEVLKDDTELNLVIFGFLKKASE